MSKHSPADGGRMLSTADSSCHECSTISQSSSVRTASEQQHAQQCCVSGTTGDDVMDGGAVDASRSTGGEAQQEGKDGGACGPSLANLLLQTTSRQQLQKQKQQETYCQQKQQKSLGQHQQPETSSHQQQQECSNVQQQETDSQQQQETDCQQQETDSQQQQQETDSQQQQQETDSQQQQETDSQQQECGSVQLSHSEMKEVFLTALSELLSSDPILGDLHPDITHQEGCRVWADGYPGFKNCPSRMSCDQLAIIIAVSSLLEVEAGRSMVVVVERADGGVWQLRLPRDARLHQLKAALKTQVTLHMHRQGVRRPIGWRGVWRRHQLVGPGGGALLDDNALLSTVGVGHKTRLSFVKRNRIRKASSR